MLSIGGEVVQQHRNQSVPSISHTKANKDQGACDGGNHGGPWSWKAQLQLCQAFLHSPVTDAVDSDLNDNQKGHQHQSSIPCNTKLEKDKFNRRNNDDINTGWKSILVDQPANEVTGQWKGNHKTQQKEADVVFHRPLNPVSDRGEDLAAGRFGQPVDRCLYGFNRHAITPLRPIRVRMPTHKRV